MSRFGTLDDIRLYEERADKAKNLYDKEGYLCHALNSAEELGHKDYIKLLTQKLENVKKEIEKVESRESK